MSLREPADDTVSGQVPFIILAGPLPALQIL